MIVHVGFTKPGLGLFITNGLEATEKPVPKKTIYIPRLVLNLPISAPTDLEVPGA